MIKKIVILFYLVSLWACESPFDVHPYDVHINGNHDINRKNIEKIKKKCNKKDTIRIAFISDSHGWYTDLKDEIAHINKRKDLDFIIHCGDLTETGTTKEYIWTRDELSKLRIPYVALIGNHDFLGTGNQVYDYIYGEKNFSFILNRTKFVCINTNATEYDYLAAVPNFDFMESEMTKDSVLFDRTLLIMHAPPYSDQFNNNVAKAFRRYIDFFPGLMCCIYGHNHNNRTEDIYNDGLLFYGIDCAAHRNYRVFTIFDKGYEEKLVYF